MSAVLRPDCFVQTVVAAALRHCSENTELIYTDSCFQQQFDCFRIRIVVAGGYFTASALLNITGKLVWAPERWMSTFCKISHYCFCC